MAELKIDVQDLHKSYGDNEVLKGIDAKFYEGDVVCIIGPSGSGKSTFLRTLNLLETVTSGKVVVDGYELSDPKTDLDKARENIGMVFQHFNLFPHMSVLDNITFAPIEHKLMTKEEAEKLGMELLDKVGLADKANANPDSLSGGQKQRLSIARAVIKGPDIYIFDDSFSALDYRTDAILRRRLKEVTQDATVLIVAQRVGTIMDADQIIVLDKGEIVGRGRHEELMETNDIYREIAESQLKNASLTEE